MCGVMFERQLKRSSLWTALLPCCAVVAVYSSVSLQAFITFNGTIYFIYLVYFTLHTANIFMEVEVMGRELTKTGIQKTEVRKDINKQLGFVYLVSNNNNVNSETRNKHRCGNV